MFEVRITSEAEPLLRRAVAEGPARTGIVISRQGPVGDVKRGASGEALWSIEQRHPWQMEIQSLEPIPDADLMRVGEFLVWLPLLPRPGELGVVISAQGGQLRADALPG